jgi:hypothetical protein
MEGGIGVVSWGVEVTDNVDEGDWAEIRGRVDDNGEEDDVEMVASRSWYS